MNYESQEEHDHFEGAMEQSVPQEEPNEDKGMSERFDSGYTFTNDGKRICAVRDGEEVGVVTEYKHSEYGHLFEAFIHSENQRAYKQGLEDAVEYIKTEIPYTVLENLFENAKNLSAKK